MITIGHDKSWPWGAKVWGLPHTGQGIVDAFYAIGSIEPNYPVPAIPLAVERRYDEYGGELLLWQEATRSDEAMPFNCIEYWTT